MTHQTETAVTVDALARMLSAADVEINHGDYPTWDTLAESGQKQYRQAARYLLKRLHITAPAAVSAAVAPPTQAAPSLRAGLRDEIVKALGRITTVLPVAHRREQADHVLAVLYREWPWLRAEAEDAEPTDRAAVLREAATLLDQRASGIDALSSSDFGEEARAVRELARAATELRRMADETATETPSMRLARQSVQAMADTLQRACPPGCVACATDESHDPGPAAGARQDGTET